MWHRELAQSARAHFCATSGSSTLRCARRVIKTGHQLRSIHDRPGRGGPSPPLARGEREAGARAASQLAAASSPRSTRDACELKVTRAVEHIRMAQERPRAIRPPGWGRRRNNDEQQTRGARNPAIREAAGFMPLPSPERERRGVPDQRHQMVKRRVWPFDSAHFVAPRHALLMSSTVFSEFFRRARVWGRRHCNRSTGVRTAQQPGRAVGCLSCARLRRGIKKSGHRLLKSCAAFAPRKKSLVNRKSTMR